MFFRPPRISIFLTQFSVMLFSLLPLRYFSLLYLLIFFFAVMLYRCFYYRRIYDCSFFFKGFLQVPSYFITFDEGARLEIMKKPHVADCEKTLARTGYIHIAFSVGSNDAVDALTERLKNAGYEVVSGPRTTGDGYYESCIVAIEDNQIEITV